MSILTPIVSFCIIAEHLSYVFGDCVELEVSAEGTITGDLKGN